jgi:hypothetical protein
MFGVVDSLIAELAIFNYFFCFDGLNAKYRHSNHLKSH